MLRLDTMILGWFLLAILLVSVAAEADEVLRNVYEGPSANGGSCPSADDTISEGKYVRMHFTVTIDETSETGEKGKVMESTRETGEPIGVTLGHGEVIPGWDEGLMGMCTGDKAVLVVPPHLAYGNVGTGTGEDDVPPGATIKFDIEIISVMEGPTKEEDEAQATAMFEGADTDKDGKLSRAEFDAMFASQIGEVDSADEMAAIQEQLQKFWESQDQDKDGVLTLEEFLAPSTFDIDMEPEEHTPEEEFASLDKDGDGKLSKEEIDGFFVSLGQEAPEDFWEHLDENKDGFITFDEFFADIDEFDVEDEDEEDYGGVEEEL